MRWWWVFQTRNSTHPAGFPLRCLSPNFRHKGQCLMLPLPLRTMLSTMPFRCRSMSFPYLPILDCYLFLSDWEGRVDSFFLFASPYVRNFLVPSSDRIGRFRFGGFSKVGIRWCKVCRTKYYLSLWGWRFFRTTASGLTLQQRIVPKLPLPQQRKWHTDACPEGGMETEAYTWRGEKEKGTDGMA